MLSKRRFILILTMALVLTLLVTVYIQTNYYQLNKISLGTEKIPEGTSITILQISDLHNKEFGDNKKKLLQTIKELNPDIVALTGDLIDADTEQFKDVFQFVENIQAMNRNTFFVSGNHEWRNTETERFLAGLKRRDIEVLNNKNTQVTVRQTTINLAGVDDFSTGHENVKAAFKNVDTGKYTILLSHAPGIVKSYDLPADLILSGHTHGGQIRLPFIGAVVAPGQGFFPELEKGLYNLGENKRLYIDSGLGTSIIPVRFLNQSQITLITIYNP